MDIDFDKWVECSSMIWETGVLSQVESCQKTQKMVLVNSLFNTQYYTVRIKDKMQQSSERSWAVPDTSV